MDENVSVRVCSYAPKLLMCFFSPHYYLDDHYQVKWMTWMRVCAHTSAGAVVRRRSRFLCCSTGGARGEAAGKRAAARGWETNLGHKDTIRQRRRKITNIRSSIASHFTLKSMLRYNFITLAC